MPVMLRGLLALLIYFSAVHGAASEGIKLRYAQAYSAMRTIFALPIFIAEREGFFTREGLDFSQIPVSGGGVDLVAALHNGSADIAHVATAFLVQSVMKGSDAVAVAAEFNNPVYSLIARPEIRSYADLKGKHLGVAAETGSITLSIRKLLAMNGVKREDFRATFVDGTPERLTCLFRRDCDAVPLGQPHDFQALRRGYQLIGVSTDAVPYYLYTVTVARRSWAEANADKLTRYARAMAGAFKYIREPQNRDNVVRTIVETTGFTEETAKLTLQLYFEPERNVLPIRGEIDIKGMQAVIDLMAEGGVLKPPLPSPERFIDLRYLQAAGVQ